MKTISIIKQLTPLLVAGSLMFGCKKDTDQSTVEPISTIPQQSLSLAANEATGPMTKFTTVYNTDYLSVGTGGLRDGYGQIRVIGTFPLSGVNKAYLYWHGGSPAQEETGKTLKVNGITITGTNIGISAGTDEYNSSVTNTQAYRADVTALIKSSSSSSRTFNLSDFGRMNAGGASLILFYSDGISSNNRDIVIFNGNDTNDNTFQGYPNNPNSPVDLTGWDVFLSGANYTTGKVNITMHVANGDKWPDGALYLNGIDIGDQLFNGTTVPGGTSAMGSYWDILPLEVSSYLSPGINPLRVQMPDYYDDVMNLVVLVFNFPKGAAPVKVIKVPFDLKPISTYDPGGQIVRATSVILGTSTFNVTQVDLSTLRLNGVPFETSSIRDISGDGVKDLELIFRTAVQDKTYIKVTLTGKLLPQYGSTAIEGIGYFIPST
ncbi:DUF3344 domain-containing protein [Arcticibacter eurypsychrophilus]|uniref:DUF3344 domain-containing protein n=1 Tax=Arcticibacter eurypsychrophilus TaxID=1434752 RepID=UPI00084D9AB5|nr:DUF3344 domain-containing protein [Arcticibacter eurypsychrophilus]